MITAIDIQFEEEYIQKYANGGNFICEMNSIDRKSLKFWKCVIYLEC